MEDLVGPPPTVVPTAVPVPTEDTPAEREAKAILLAAQVAVAAERVEEVARVEAAVVKALLASQLYRLRWEMRAMGGLTVCLSAGSLLAVLTRW